MQLDDARRALRVLTAAFPRYPVSDDTAELYLAMLCQHVRDPDVGVVAAQKVALTALDFPKPTQLLEACQAEARLRVKAQPAIPEDTGRELSPQENAAKVAELKQQLKTLIKRAP